MASSSSALAADVFAKHLDPSKTYSRPINLNTDVPKRLATILMDLKQDGFLDEIKQHRKNLKSASRVELERLEVKYKHNLAEYKTLLEKIEGMDQEKEVVQDLTIEIRSRMVLSQSIRNAAAFKLNDLILKESVEASGNEMDKIAPTLFDASAFPRYEPKPVRVRPTIEPQK